MPEKRILIISYYFPPLTGAPSWRAFSWSRFLRDYGYYPFILTRHWKGNETTWEDHIKDEGNREEIDVSSTYTCYRIKSRKTRSYLIFSNKGGTILGRLYFFWSYLVGQPNPETNAWFSFKAKAIDLVKKEKLDAVVITGPPSNIYRLAATIKKHTRAKVVTDFRDLNNNAVLNKDYKPGIRQRFFDFLFDFHLKRWLSFSDIVTTVAPAFAFKLQGLTSKPVKVVFNGYDDDVFKQISVVRPSEFTISMIGALYEKQPYQLILEGLKAFLSKNNSIQLKVLLPGIMSDRTVGQKFADALRSDSRVRISDRISKEEAVTVALQSHVLLFTSWPDRPGMIPAKIFDYMASGNLVLNCAPDGSTSEQMLANAGIGINADSVELIEQHLSEAFKNWITGASSIINPNWDFIKQYSRSAQARSMAGVLDMILK